MPPNSEIEKLERRWKENPRGTVFAPYAEVLRKHGDHLLARDVLRQGLELHPDHIPGNIVLGRCCLDLREDGPAEAAFHHVLELDRENVIALKALADITERQGRLMEAADWLARLIAVDPSNDEARDQLGRVDAAREAAAAAMTPPLVGPAGGSLASSHAEVVVEALPLSTVPPSNAGVPAVEVAAGRIGDHADAELDARFSLFDEPPAGNSPAEELRTITPEPVAEDVVALPVVETVESLVLEPGELEQVAGLQPGTGPADAIANFSASVDLELERTGSGEEFPLGQEEPGPIELRPSGATEFQAPDDSLALLDLTPGGSEFQVPDASSELMLSSAGGAEFQTPSGADELLRRPAERAPDRDDAPAPKPEAPPEPEPVIALETEPARPHKQVFTTGFAAITLTPAEELLTEPAGQPAAEPLEIPAPEPEPVAELVPEEEPGSELMLTGAESEPDSESAAGPGSSLLEMLAAASTAQAPEVRPVPEPDPEPDVVEPVAQDQHLKLIFPDEAAEPAPPRIRRISAEMAAVAEPAAPEPAVQEPAPVLTESMAELYVRQGHLAEAIHVYQVLAERWPNDFRLQEKVRTLQAALAAGSRRPSYVAGETGGESVESFFRALADARPADGAPPGPAVEGEQGGGAPTRPANDPLSLSAIFGEEAASAPSAPAAGEGLSKASAPDAFSFDQFFGAAPSGGASGAPGGANPSAGEDLDQFQHWLKSLKK